MTSFVEQNDNLKMTSAYTYFAREEITFLEKIYCLNPSFDIGHKIKRRDKAVIGHILMLIEKL